jgi:hypothetical protein
MVALVNRAGESDPLAVGRITRTRILFIVIRDACESARAVGVDSPYVRVAALVEGFARAVGDEGDLSAVGRPLRVCVVPIVAGSDLPRRAALNVNDEDVAALVVEPARVVELVGRVLVVAHVGRRRARVALSRAAQDREARPVRRPLNVRRAVLQVRHAARLAAVERKHIDLRARRLRHARG